MGIFAGMGHVLFGNPKVTGGINTAKQDLTGLNSARQNADIAWQRNMEASNTAVQRRMADIKAAGINPIMAVNSATGGASTPNAPMANSAVITKAQAELIKAQVGLTRAQTGKTNMETAMIIPNTASRFMHK